MAMLRVIYLFLLLLGSEASVNSSTSTQIHHLRHVPPMNTSNTTRRLTSKIRLTMYKNILGYLNWHEPWFDTYMQNNCNYCSFSTIPTTARSADMILFLASTFAKSTPPFPNKQSHQLFTLHTMEQPKYVPMMTNPSFLAKFDLLATYSQASVFPGTNVPNLPLSYYPLEVYDAKRVMHEAPPFKLKTAFDTVAFISNCRNAGAEQRTAYVTELMQHIKVAFRRQDNTYKPQVHSYGRCLNNRVEPSMPADPNWPEHSQKRASHYKFYLAFENFEIQDYVSEKIYEGLFAGSIPIYRGTRNIADFMPSPDCFIDANDLSPTELAKLLHKLAQDEEEYNKYFAFKEKPLSEKFVAIAESSYSHPKVLCRLCDYVIEHRKNLHNDKN